MAPSKDSSPGRSLSLPLSFHWEPKKTFFGCLPVRSARLLGSTRRDCWSLVSELQSVCRLVPVPDQGHKAGGAHMMSAAPSLTPLALVLAVHTMSSCDVGILGVGGDFCRLMAGLQVVLMVQCRSGV